MDFAATVVIGQWFVDKFHEQIRKNGVFRAAQNMRKQGAPLDIALEVVRCMPR